MALIFLKWGVLSLTNKFILDHVKNKITAIKTRIQNLSLISTASIMGL